MHNYNGREMAKSPSNYYSQIEQDPRNFPFKNLQSLF